MPGRRAIVVAATMGIFMGWYLGGLQNWPTFLAVAVGATMALAVLLFAAKLTGDPAEAEAAWKEAAPDLARRERGEAAVEPGPDRWPTPRGERR